VSLSREPVTPALDLLVELERDGNAPLHEQLEQLLREQVRSGRLSPGLRIPSSRALASELGVSRGVVLEAYAQLTAEGYLTSTQGGPTRIAAASSIERPPLPAASFEPRRAYEFDPDLPDLAAFPHENWLRSLRTVLRQAPFQALGRDDPRGLAELRNQLMGYLARVRGAAPEPEHTLVCAGFRQGFAVLCRTLRERGVERIGLEDPGWPAHRLVAAAAGLEPVGIPVDELGISVRALADSGCEAVVVTPAHQHPTGVVLASERRTALLEWAEDRDALIVEDDYDSELRYDRVAIGALQGLAPERVCTIGSLSARLAPGLRLGWILSPSWLTGALTYEQGVRGGGPPTIEQLALADFIARGELDRHLRRMRLRYRARRQALIEALRRHLPDGEPVGVPAGLHALVLFAAGVDEDRLVTAASAAGVGLEGLRSHRITAVGGPGAVFGFASLPEPAIARGVELLAQAAFPGHV
jgi:GntR family transcriptional regulator/MocR family aminotransferase